MAAETPEQKYERIRERVQQIMLASHPNPDREGCSDLEAVKTVARRVAAGEKLGGDKDYDHVMHCSPCYQDFLDAREELRQSTECSQPVRLSCWKERRLARTLDELDLVLKSLFRAN